MLIEVLLCCFNLDGPIQATEVAAEDIKRVYNLFLDLKRSEAYLRAYQDEFMFSDKQDDAKMGDE